MLRRRRKRYRYKVLGPGGRARNGGHGHWSLPTYDAETDRWTPGRWMPRRHVSLCNSGWHLTTFEGVIKWASTGSYDDSSELEIYLARGRGVRTVRTLLDRDKRAYSSARLLRRLNWGPDVQRRWIADVIEHVTQAAPSARGPALDEYVRLVRDPETEYTEALRRDVYGRALGQLDHHGLCSVISTTLRGPDARGRPVLMLDLILSRLVRFGEKHGVGDVRTRALRLLYDHLHAGAPVDTHDDEDAVV